MNASAKLRALSTTPTGEQRVLDALPQIIAVVEAAGCAQMLLATAKS